MIDRVFTPMAYIFEVHDKSKFKHDIHLANTLFVIKVGYKNMASVCSGNHYSC